MISSGPMIAEGWAGWAPHHLGFPAVADGFDAELDSSAFAAHWGGFPDDFAGVVVNLRADDRAAVDAIFDQAHRGRPPALSDFT